MSSNNSLAAPTVNSSGIDGAYQALARAEHGSPEAMAAIADIQAAERAYAKSQENVIKGTGISGHESGRYAIMPKDASPGREASTPGAVSGGNSQSSPDMRTDIVKIGGYETSVAVAEAMRRGMTADEWTAATGLPYQSLTMTNGTATAQPRPRQHTDNKLAALDEALDKELALEKMTAAEEDAKTEADETAALNYDTSLLEQVVKQGYGPEIAESLTREVVDSGDLEAESLVKHGVTPDMMEDAVAHYTQAAENMLAKVNSSVAYMSEFLSDAEAKQARQAIVGRDMATVQRLGEAARDRAAGMSFKEVSEFLTKDEKALVRLRSVNGTPVVDVNGVTTSWGSAVINRLVAFDGKK